MLPRLLLGQKEAVDIRKWEQNECLIFLCFIQDGALFVDGQSGKIFANQYIIDLSTRFSDKNGGTGHRNASAAGIEGCLAIKCSEDSCLIDGKGKGDLKVFPGQKEAVKVPVQPKIQES